MSNMQEAQGVMWFEMYHPVHRKKVNITLRVSEGETLSPTRIDEIMASFAYGVDAAVGAGFKVSLSDVADDVVVKEGDFWVRAKSRNGHDVVYAYVDHPKMQNKSITFYVESINDLPITPAEWESAPLWPGDQAPEKDRAENEGYLQAFPHRIEVAMYDTGKTFLPPGKTEPVPVYRPDRVLNAAPGGLALGDGKRQAAQAAPRAAQASQSASVGTVINNSGVQCPHCHAPHGKPHGKVKGGACPGITGGSSDAPAKPGPSPRQRITAALKIMGEHLFGDEWDDRRANAVNDISGGTTKSAADLTDDQLSALATGLREQIVNECEVLTGALGLDDHALGNLLSDEVSQGKHTIGELNTSELIKAHAVLERDAAIESGDHDALAGSDDIPW